MSFKISIGSALYNVSEPHLIKHIESIMKQLTSEVEFLLIDDASTNNTAEICKKYAENRDNVRYIKIDKNSGLSSVRNRTIAEASGEWIFFADGDDIVADHALETALSFCDEKYDIIIHDRRKFYTDKTNVDPVCTVKSLKELPESAARDISISCLCMMPLSGDRYGMTKYVYYHAAWGAIYRRDYLLENNLQFPVGQKKAQDSVFNTYAYYNAKNIAYLPYVMYYYRKDMQGITQRYNPDYPETAMSLIRYHYVCMEKLYPGDKDIEEKYKNFRLISLAVDYMKLNPFHPDNPKSKEERKKDFTEFINTEPFKSAIDGYTRKNVWWGYIVPIDLARRGRFSTLDFFFKHWSLFKIYGKVYKFFRIK